jgi:hypothetical protein
MVSAPWRVAGSETSRRQWGQEIRLILEDWVSEIAAKAPENIRLVGKKVLV